jgi:hypothetical protein
MLSSILPSTLIERRDTVGSTIITVRNILFIFLAFSFLSCQYDDYSLSPGSLEGIPVSLNIEFDGSVKENAGIQTLKRNINDITVSITGSGLNNPITSTLSISGGQASGRVTLPLGSKTFTVSAAVVSEENRFELFRGSRTVDVTKTTDQVSIILSENTTDQITGALHNNSFNAFRSSETAGNIVAGRFVTTGGHLFIKRVAYNLRWNNNPGDYRIVIRDNTTVFFRSNTISPALTDGWIEWNLVWSNPADGFIEPGKEIYVGMEYAGSTGYPRIGFDTSNPTGASVYLTVTGTQEIMNDGDFGITVWAQTKSGNMMKLLAAWK